MTTAASTPEGKARLRARTKEINHRQLVQAKLRPESKQAIAKIAKSKGTTVGHIARLLIERGLQQITEEEFYELVEASKNDSE
jgi:hypothetical protein